MPDFSLTVSAPSGLSLGTWLDPASASPPAPSRISSNPLHPQLYRRIEAPGAGQSITITVTATVGGVVGPADPPAGAAFFWTWAEWSGPAPAPIVPTPGQSSVARISWIGPSANGHYLLSVRHAGGGAMLVPFDVEA